MDIPSLNTPGAAPDATLAERVREWAEFYDAEIAAVIAGVVVLVVLARVFIRFVRTHPDFFWELEDDPPPPRRD